MLPLTMVSLELLTPGFLACFVRSGAVGVDPAREGGDTNAISAGVADWRSIQIRGSELVEAPNMTATEVDAASRRASDMMAERVSRTFAIDQSGNGNHLTPGTTMRIEDLQRAQRTLRELGVEEGAAVRYLRDMEGLMRAEVDRQRQRFASVFGAFGIADYILPPDRCPDEGAEARGMKLLKEWLAPAQLDQFERAGYFDVSGGTSGKRYRIRRGSVQNVFELDGEGREICGWCFAPEGHLVAGDVMLAQKVALETDELGALKVANRFQADVYLTHLNMRPGGISWVDPGWVEGAGTWQRVRDLVGL